MSKGQYAASAHAIAASGATSAAKPVSMAYQTPAKALNNARANNTSNALSASFDSQ